MLLSRESNWINSLEFLQEQAGLAQVAINGRLREVAQLVVVAFVAEDGGKLRTGTQRVLPVFSEQVVQLLDALLYRWYPRLFWKRFHLS